MPLRLKVVYYNYSTSCKIRHEQFMQYYIYNILQHNNKTYTTSVNGAGAKIPKKETYHWASL